MTSYGDLRDEFLGVDMARDSEDLTGNFELSFEPEEYYHIICENCKVEDFISGYATISTIELKRRELCDCEGPGAKKQKVVTEVESVFSCYRCGKSQPSEAIGDGVFCVDCAEKVRNYIQNGGVE